MSQPLSGLFGGDSVNTSSGFPCLHLTRTLFAVAPIPLPAPEADSRLMAGRSTRHVADAVLPPHGSTVRHLHL